MIAAECRVLVLQGLTTRLDLYTANTRHGRNAGTMLVHRLQRRPDIETTLLAEYDTVSTTARGPTLDVRI